MKNLFTASILAVSVCLFSCSDNKNSDEYNRAAGSTTDMNAPATGDASNPFAPAPENTNPAAGMDNSIQPVAQSTGNVKHYTCPAGHIDGGADIAGNCSVCGAELAHNAAFHNQPAQTTPQQTDPTSIQPQITPATTPPIEPAQNSSGVFHYVCSEGHAGGSGTAEACKTCGGTLVHNDKYHQ
ncbi:MAG: heavy metal-binding domain-containing protein [Bacteroidia bacterium]|nr:hypothetical protein [Nitrosopumilus sp.]